jgi:hypothetical protein
MAAQERPGHQDRHPPRDPRSKVAGTVEHDRERRVFTGAMIGAGALALACAAWAVLDNVVVPVVLGLVVFGIAGDLFYEWIVRIQLARRGEWPVRIERRRLFGRVVELPPSPDWPRRRHSDRIEELAESLLDDSALRAELDRKLDELNIERRRDAAGGDA